MFYEAFNCSNVVKLIVGGEAAKMGEFPHHALLGYVDEQAETSAWGQYKFNCGGSLISDRFVVTAAHCFSFADPVIVRLGEHDLDAVESNRVDFDIAQITRHPLYRNSRSYHDIALVRLNGTTVIDPRSCIYHVIGVTSTGGACGIGLSKAIYINVMKYLDWIEQTVWQ
ncbi:serine protease [Anopheles darlingi]|uniref:Serine protease n=1 Tax=Anopheles darlingi TaxID=43151 RepID=W5JM17_ANODA|nr:serine protease [Anopheles darlingi]